MTPAKGLDLTINSLLKKEGYFTLAETCRLPSIDFVITRLLAKTWRDLNAWNLCLYEMVLDTCPLLIRDPSQQCCVCE